MMPRKDGFEVAADIRRKMEGNPVKVLLTAKGTTKDKMDGYHAGGDIYLTKPFDNQELLDTIAEVLEFERSSVVKSNVGGDVHLSRRSTSKGIRIQN